MNQMNMEETRRKIYERIKKTMENRIIVKVKRDGIATVISQGVESYIFPGQSLEWTLNNVPSLLVENQFQPVSATLKAKEPEQLDEALQAPGLLLKILHELKEINANVETIKDHDPLC